MDSMVILIGLMITGVIAGLVLLGRRERAARRLSEHPEPEYRDDQAEARAAAQAAQAGRGGGWPTP
jgi:hypothetical protein